MRLVRPDRARAVRDVWENDESGERNTGVDWGREERDSGGGRREGGDGARDPEQEEVDAILDKISRSGMGSLTDEEKEKLRRASDRRRLH